MLQSPSLLIEFAYQDLGGNPFVFKPAQPKPKLSGQIKKRRARKDPAQQRVEDALADVKRLRLQMVVAGAAPTAVISDCFLEVGGVIQGWRVAEILPRQVVLTWQDKKHVLEME